MTWGILCKKEAQTASLSKLALLTRECQLSKIMVLALEGVNC